MLTAVGRSRSSLLSPSQSKASSVASNTQKHGITRSRVRVIFLSDLWTYNTVLVYYPSFEQEALLGMISGPASKSLRQSPAEAAVTSKSF